MSRLLSGVVLAAAALAALLFLPPIAIRLLVCLVAALAAHEYLRIAGSDNAAILLVVALCWVLSGAFAAPAEAALLVALAWVAVLVLFVGRSIQQAATGLFAAVYVGMPLGMLAAVHISAGRQATLLLLATVVVSDTLQYYSGRLFGRHRLAPSISPGKTIEGAIGGLVAGTLFMTIAGGRLFPASSPAQLAAMGLLVVALGICGDLFESRLKRLAGVKDSGTIIPGHGGVLDRIDALLFVSPAFYVYVRSIA